MMQLSLFVVLALAASVRGQQCAFPFTYGGNTYTSCTSAGSTGFWCSTDHDYSGNWKYCDEQECTFPFIYNGQTFTSCATGGSFSRPWCSLDPLYQGNFVYCSDDAVIVEPLADKPEACHFPFEYRGQTYSSCTLEDYSDYWCSLDAVYAGNYKICGEEECVFPFTYDGELYDECVDKDDDDGRWCSLDHVYQGNSVSCEDEPCGDTLNKDSGFLTSPNYPSNYDNNMDCAWTIPARGGTVHLMFLDFLVQGVVTMFGSCGPRSDHVEIFAGDRSLGRWCGDVSPGNISSNQDVTVRMFTDSSTADRGFKLKYRVEGGTPFGPGQEECGGLLHGQQGEVVSPGFPVAYHDDIDCTWHLNAKQSGMQLDFPDFDLEKPGEYQGCSYDFVEIYKGEHRIGRFCGDSAPPTATYYEKVSIRFKTDQHTVARGFRFNWAYLSPPTDTPDGSGEGSGAVDDSDSFF